MAAFSKKYPHLAWLVNEKYGWISIGCGKNEFLSVVSLRDYTGVFYESDELENIDEALSEADKYVEELYAEKFEFDDEFDDEKE